MVKGHISLNINNLKEIKMGFQQSTFYLAFHSNEDDYFISPCKNILFDCSPFEVENLEEMSKI